MDNFELNKIAGAVLGGALAVVAISEIANIAVSPTFPEQNAYAIEVASTGGDSSAAAEVKEEGPSLGALLASADVAKGEKVFKKCSACHTTEEGGANKIGPNLYAVLDRAKASHAGFSYSDAMVSHGGTWTYEDLDAFLKKPKDFINGTKMSFAGLKKADDRADLIAYLRTLGTESTPLPAAE
ncbi:c-type cytochrome [Sneathiella chinensis]|uniref:Cytochrome c family protein n=1 Tax=Sneathiella chinensis TaxID=349750 RepID=A0ABQ5U2D2_9PROT|nr:cytochrome c family protein [Sneathiella chinensis]GLQ05424.1 cytochrome c family protein [Sneathiella chinensis]